MDRYKFISTKEFFDFPCAHRQWNHQGHCSFIHGYSRSFKFFFGANELDENNFVVDFSSLKLVQEHLTYMYDHTTLIAKDDPEIELFKKLDSQKIIQLRIVDNPSMERTAHYLYDFVQNIISKRLNNRVNCIEVIARENQKNSAHYVNPNL